MSSLKIRSHHINRTWEPILYQMGDEQRYGLEDLLRFYSPYGPVRKILTYFGSGGTMPIYVGNAQYYDFEYVLRKLIGLTGIKLGLKRTLFAGGKGHDLFGMFITSLSETVERVLGALHYFKNVDKLIFGTYRQLTSQGYNCIHPSELPLFAPEQFYQPDFLYEQFTENSNISWIEGKRLLSGEKIWLPAQVVLLFYTPRKDETTIGYSTTGGLASHINEREALYHGITELFERDAVNLRWYCKIDPEIIEFDRAPKKKDLRRLLSLATGLPGKLTFYHHSLDIPELPIVTVIEIDEWLNRYAYYSGGGVDLDIDTCLLSSLNEFGQSERNMRLSLAAPEWGFARGVQRMFNVDEDEDVSKIDIFFKIVAYYGYPKNIEKMEWYVNGERRIPLSSLPSIDFQSPDERWDYLIEVLKRHQIDPIIFDFTPPQMNHIKLMKTYIPELAPPYMPSLPLLGHPRYYEVPQKLGYADHRLTFSELNTDPLPYP